MRTFYGSKLATASDLHAARAANEAVKEAGTVRCGVIDEQHRPRAIRYAIEHRWFYRVFVDGIAYYSTNQEG